MPPLKLTPASLKEQRDHLRRYERYLPTLRLKQWQLQRETDRVAARARAVAAALAAAQAGLADWVTLWAEDQPLEAWLRLEDITVRWENLAGVAVPVFVAARVSTVPYDLLRTPPWVDEALAVLRQVQALTAEQEVLAEQHRRLFRELRTTAQRVNLFAEIKLPAVRANIQRITVHLGDQQTAAFGWALRAKRQAARAAAAAHLSGGAP